MRRRGAPASLVRAGPCGAPFCSGGNLRTGSAIALLLLVIDAFALDGVAHIFLDGLQLGETAMSIGAVDALERGRRELRTQAAQFAEQRPRGLAQIKTVDPAIGFI